MGAYDLSLNGAGGVTANMRLAPVLGCKHHWRHNMYAWNLLLLFLQE